MAKTKKPAVTMDKDEATVVNGPSVVPTPVVTPTVKVKKTKLKHGPSEPGPAVEPKDVKVTTPVKPEVVQVPKVKPTQSAEVKPKPAISKNMTETLNALKGGKPMTHTQIALLTKREKGNKLRELTAAGLVTTGSEEGVRGYVYTITKAGLKAITK